MCSSDLKRSEAREQAFALVFERTINHEPTQDLSLIHIYIPQGSQDPPAKEPVYQYEKGAANGVATLDSHSKIPSVQRPSLYATLKEYASYEDLGVEATATFQQIYNAMPDNSIV